MDLGNKTLLGSFNNTERKKIERKLVKKFAGEEVFSLTGKKIKRSKGMGAFG